MGIADSAFGKLMFHGIPRTSRRFWRSMETKALAEVAKWKSPVKKSMKHGRCSARYMTAEELICGKYLMRPQHLSRNGSQVGDIKQISTSCLKRDAVK